ncbi:hypothetical protein LTR06_007038 [Exophiala xenobiotica]|nr:hypothetical protein LTR06_007038 [Exophiala xenobiotica]
MPPVTPTEPKATALTTFKVVVTTGAGDWDTVTDGDNFRPTPTWTDLPPTKVPEADPTPTTMATSAST